ncbi:MAG: hypothetical protein U0271_47870 [Polyangiaceae bacterium]
MKSRAKGLLVLGLMGAGFAACHDPGSSGAFVGRTPTATVSLEYVQASCARQHPGVGPVRASGAREGASVALAREAEKLYAYVVDRDSEALTVVDVRARKVVASEQLGPEPEQVLVLEDGRVAVSSSRKSTVEVFEPTGQAERPLEKRCERQVPSGPFGLAQGPNNGPVVVTSADEPALTVLDPEDLRVTGAAALPRAPRGALVDGTGRVFVTHVVGAAVSVVQLSSLNRPRSIPIALRPASMRAEVESLTTDRSGSQAYALASVEITNDQRTLVDRGLNGGERKPTVTGDAPPTEKKPTPSKKPPKTPPKQPEPQTPPTQVDPDPKPEAPPIPALPEPASVQQTLVVPMVSVDPGDATRGFQNYYGPPPVAGVPKHAPTAVVIDPVAERSLSTRVLAVTPGLRSSECNLPRSIAFRQSTARLYVACLGTDEVLELDARSADPMRAVLARYSVPKGPTGVAVSDADGLAVVLGQFDGSLAVISLDSGKTETVPLDYKPTAFVADHQQGRELFYRTNDSRITSDGIACANCHPDGTDDGITWRTPEGPRQTLMLAGRLHGTAPFGWAREKYNVTDYISDTSSRLGGNGLSNGELDELAEFVVNLPDPPVRPKQASDLIAHGRDLFVTKGCDSCHTGLGTTTDARYHPFSKTDADSAEGFDTPTLRFVGLSAPYFHDGRYKTLDDVLGDSLSTMPNTAGLSSGEQAALKAYLETL